MLWEILGLGSGSMPLTLRFIAADRRRPLLAAAGDGAAAAVARQGAADARHAADARSTSRSTPACSRPALYLLLSERRGRRRRRRAARPGRDRRRCSACSALLGLRDKVSFLAARPEIYGFLLLVSLFPLEQPDRRLAARLLLHLVGRRVVEAEPPLPVRDRGDGQQHALEPLAARRRRSSTATTPRTCGPSPHAALGAHLGTAIEFSAAAGPAARRSGGTIGTLAVVGMIIFHVHITSTFALGVPLEWNLFMIFGLCFLFGHYGDVPLSTLDDPLLIAILVADRGRRSRCSATCCPDQISFLPSMRYYAGNWATSQWLFRKRQRRRGEARPRGRQGRADRRSSS